jgi:hypothetical protein
MKASFWFSIDHPTMDPSAELEHSAILFVREVVVVTLDRFLSVGKEKCLNASKSFLDVTCQ